VEAIVESGVYVRYGKWNQSIAIGTQRFAENTKQKLGQIKVASLLPLFSNLTILIWDRADNNMI
jgi:hypothetical protein